MIPDWSLEGHTALVTGGGGAIGSAIATDLQAMGARVVLADRDLPAAQAVASRLGGSASAAYVDLAEDDSIAELTQAILADQGCSVLVSNAGIAHVEPFVGSSPATWDTMYQVNQRAPMSLTQRLLPAMAEAGFGRLIYISSDGARAGSSGEAAYAATKASLFGFAKSIAHEVARDGVTANVVCPGPIDTPMVAEAMAGKPGMLARLERAIPMRRIGQPEDPASAVAWLASPRAGYVTGQVISVSGGITMH